MKPLITNIQRFCVNDGPGIRTTVFFKGCSLHCPWCANPENIHFEEEIYFIVEKCKSSCKYIEECMQKKYLLGCPYGAVGKWGEYFSEEELYTQLIKDINYYGEEGGVTFSGGEPLLFLNCYEKTLIRLKQNGINLAIETALNVSEEIVMWSIKYIDIYYVDIKTMNKDIFNHLIGGDILLYKKNVAILQQNKKKVIFRIPIISNHTDDEQTLQGIKEYLDEIGAQYIEIFSVHNLAKKKYERLSIDYKTYELVGEEKLSRIKKILQNSYRSITIKHI